MRIITVNLPTEIIAMIDRMVGENGLYPSRSELVRVAVREFLVQEIQSAKTWINATSAPPDERESKFIRAKAPIQQTSPHRREVDITGILAQIPNETE